MSHERFVCNKGSAPESTYSQKVVLIKRREDEIKSKWNAEWVWEHTKYGNKGASMDFKTAERTNLAKWSERHLVIKCNLVCFIVHGRRVLDFKSSVHWIPCLNYKITVAARRVRSTYGLSNVITLITKKSRLKYEHVDVNIRYWFFNNPLWCMDKKRCIYIRHILYNLY